MSGMAAVWLQLALAGTFAEGYRSNAVVSLSSAWSYSSVPSAPAAFVEGVLSHWRALGLPVVDEGVEGRGVRMISAFWTRERQQELVVAIPSGEGSVVFRVLRNVPRLSVLQPGSELTGLNSTFDRGQTWRGPVARSGTWRLGLRESGRRWRDSLRALGYDAEADAPGESLLRFRARGGREVWLVLAPIAPGRTAWTLLGGGES